MKKNRKYSKKMNVMASRTIHIGAVVLMLVGMVLINMLASSRCDQQLKEIGEKERLLKQCEDDYQRASSKWEKMKDASTLDHALLKHGMSMKYPKADQVIRMDEGGRLVRGQHSVMVAERKRKQSGKTVQVRSEGR